MSISLKYVGDKISNHETRIKALEDGKSNLRYTTLLTVNSGIHQQVYNLSESIHNFDMLIFDIANDSKYLEMHTILWTKYIKMGQVYQCYPDGGNRSYFKFNNPTQVQCVKENTWFYAIYGLKVYYTFSIILMLILSNFLNIFIRKEVI